MKRIVLLAIICILPLFLQGCESSYPTGQVEDAIKKICEDEYGVDVEVKGEGKTLGALIVMNDTLMKDLSLSDQALSKIENVMLTTSRVTMSSEFKYDFFVVSIRDVLTGVEVSFVRYIKDIRRLIIDDISRNDYFQRLVIDVAHQPVGLPEENVAFHLKERQLKHFLARQITERIKSKFQLNLIIKKLFHITNVEGRYLPVEKLINVYPNAGILQLKVSFHPEAPQFETIGDQALQENFKQLLFNTARKVLQRYEFKDCEGVEIVDQNNRQLASYDRDALSKDSLNSLMELIQKFKKK